MSSLPGAVREPSDPFAPTHWSVIVAAASSQSEPEKARVALEELCQTYWMPLYTFVRSRGYSVPDAQDLTQSFFVYLLEHEIYAEPIARKADSVPFCSLHLRIFWPTPTRASTP